MCYRKWWYDQLTSAWYDQYPESQSHQCDKSMQSDSMSESARKRALKNEGGGIVSTKRGRENSASVKAQRLHPPPYGLPRFPIRDPQSSPLAYNYKTPHFRHPPISIVSKDLLDRVSIATGTGLRLGALRFY